MSWDRIEALSFNQPGVAHQFAHSMPASRRSSSFTRGLKAAKGLFSRSKRDSRSGSVEGSSSPASPRKGTELEPGGEPTEDATPVGKSPKASPAEYSTPEPPAVADPPSAAPSALAPPPIVSPETPAPAEPDYGSNYSATTTATAQGSAAPLQPPPVASPAFAGSESQSKELPEGWEEVEHEDGRIYFWNYNTDEVRSHRG